jgi:mRNA interferase HicA
MKKRDLEKQLRVLGWWMKREGSNHEIWTNGIDAEPVPRHREVRENLAFCTWLEKAKIAKRFHNSRSIE